MTLLEISPLKTVEVQTITISNMKSKTQRWWFAPVNFEHGCLHDLVGDITVKNSWGANWIPRLFYEEYIILWFEFNPWCEWHLRDREEIFEAIQTVKEYLPLVCLLCISSCDGLHLWLLGGVVYLTLLNTATLKTVEVQTEYLDYFTRNIKYFGSSLICVVSNIDKTPPLGDSISVHCGFFIYIGSFQTSYIDKACHNNVDSGCLHAHYAAVKYNWSGMSQNIWKTPQCTDMESQKWGVLSMLLIKQIKLEPKDCILLIQ